MPLDIPLATYRLQLTGDFTFNDAAHVVPYLKSFGITHLYVSPFLKARTGSRHGYDVVDHRRFNPELGGEVGFARLSAAAKSAGLGLILDFVPNHMAVGFADNAWWLDVLEWGPKSRHAASFDISWELLPFRQGAGVLLPILGRPYGEALTGGEISLKYDASEGTFSAWYFEHRLPINPQRYSDIVKTIVATANAANEPAGHELLALAGDYGRPGAPSYTNAPAFKAHLAGIEGGASIIDRGLAAYRADREGGVNLLHRLLERQYYRLAEWRLAVSGINYRRFFDINELAGLRVEDARTFREMHELVARLIAADQLQGLRLDHIDGLLDPAQYTRRLQRLIRHVHPRRKPFYVVVEKIVADGEHMPALPGVAGTTGYEWLNVISRVLLDPAGHDKLAALWRGIEPGRSDFAAVLEAAKLRVLDTIMASEFGVLVQLLSRIAAGHFTTRDYSADRLREALRLYVIEFPVYRTYVTAAGPSPDDRAVIDRTIAAARKRWQGTDGDIFNFLRDALTLDLLRDGLPYSRTRVCKFALKMQQFTGPMAAKSLEDTALYRFHELLALNEVGGDPTRPALSIKGFHDRMEKRHRTWPHGLTATATHDTKRGEDARTRILALAELSDLWAEQVRGWREVNARFASPSGRRTLSHGHEYMLYQALIGAWPSGAIDEGFIRRIEEYAIKAAREGKLETSWLNPDEGYERALRDFVRAILDQGRSADFLQSFESFARRTALLGALGSLTQLVLKATMPGVPDFYQGTEFWDLSLVDPDNRRPVDFAARAAALASCDGAPDWRELIEYWQNGRIKMGVSRRLLALRNEFRGPLRDGDYTPVEVAGPDRDHILAFMRSSQKQRVIVVVSRYFSRVTDGGTHWPSSGWQAELVLNQRYTSSLYDELGGRDAPCRSLQMSDVLATLPVAVLATR